jgi:hypothetical protein
MEDHVAPDNLARLKELLEELFQFRSADLDFGIYRIMKRKRVEVRRFLDTGLAQIVDDAQSGGVASKQASPASELEEVTERIRQDPAADAISAEGDLKPGSLMRSFHTVSPRARVNKPPADVPDAAGWHHARCRPGRETRLGKEEPPCR